MAGPLGNRLDTSQGGTDYSTQKYRKDITDISNAKQDVAAGAATGPTYTYVGGTPGYTVDNTPQVNAQYNGMRDDANNVYDQAAAAIGLANKNIPQAYTQAASQEAANRAARSKALQSMVLGDRDNEADWAARMGFSRDVGTSQAATGRTTDLLRTLLANNSALAGAGNAYYNSTKNTAVARGQAAVNASNFARDQLEKQIEAARQAALAKAIYYVAGSKGKKVKTGGYTAKQASSLNGQLDNAESSLISSVQNMLGTKNWS